MIKDTENFNAIDANNANGFVVALKFFIENGQNPKNDKILRNFLYSWEIYFILTIV